MKKTKLIATIMTICLAISTLAYGVYAATNLSFTIGANIAFEVDNFFVKADAFVYNVYDANGDELGNDITISTGTEKGYSNLGIIDNSNGQSVINNDNISWTLESNLHFNPSDLTDKITFRVEVANYTPNKDIKVTIAPDPQTNTAASLTSAGITGTATSGTAVALNGTAQKAIATYELEVANLTTSIPATTIYLKVTIEENLPTITFNSNGGTSVQSVQYTGTPISAPSVPTNGTYAFAGWYTDVNDASTKITWPYTPQSNVTLTAKWVTGYLMEFYVETDSLWQLSELLYDYTVTIDNIVYKYDDNITQTASWPLIYSVYIAENSNINIDYHINEGDITCGLYFYEESGSYDVDNKLGTSIEYGHRSYSFVQDKNIKKFAFYLYD